ncbi:acyltransferase family protein [Alicyclobacillus macrosporangiidus]|uniref:Peptidoglycan/LPS O-acetylase OafA/YrhL, contains acyltransferase and SGNH-hydrolase domains n=1 Tax=Alicyclobacillus macrosporangiidus TaxID=392015 RepID=A0A1I7JID0_9BACL|nr:acyltransferase family protein [Alicyclobacillus macrosporangiidus]SFU84907.1 Peptidoglycan/LPS O-acetylase OafA/YrhL, contains acyltransferase and SGNH-hydrolase domains [Alicyclobacillus macrosporangiidus]
MPKPMRSGGRYMPGLDGLRALAVVAVVVYHLHAAWAPGGLLGVGVFFVLSGYLITDLLVAEWRRTGRLDLRGFWMRRFRRLIPALWLMIGGVCAWLAASDPGRLEKLRGDIGAAFLYVSNWWYVFHQVSYFDRFGPPSPFGHLWSLAVEEQFYLVWPLLLGVGLRRLRRGTLLGWTLIGAAVSALSMALLFQPGTDPSRIYYGTDTRAFALLLGAALALVWPSEQLPRWRTRRSRFAADGMGVAGLAVILVMFFTTDEYGAFLYRGGMVLLSLATAAVVAAAAHPDSRLGRALGWGPLRWLGMRSYGIYLWHYPVLALSTPLNTAGDIDWVRMLLQVLASVGLAALSWRYVEQPILRMGKAPGSAPASGALDAPRRHGQGTSRRGRTHRNRRTHRHRRSAVAAMWAASAAVLAIAAAMWFSPNAGASLLQWTGGGEMRAHLARPVSGASAASQTTGDAAPSSGKTGHAGTGAQGDGQAQGGGQAPGDGETAGWNGQMNGAGSPPQKTGAGTTASGPSASQDGGTSGGTAGNGSGQAGGSNAPGRTETAHPVNPGPLGAGITAIGDSVLEDAKPYLEKLLPGIVVDAQVGRQFTEAAQVIGRLQQQRRLGDTVIIELGNNGPFTEQQMDDLLAQLGSRRVVLVNVRVPRPWQDVVNRTLAAVAADHPGLTLVDWCSASAGKTQWFYADGVHLNPAGSQAYAQLLAGAVRPGDEAARTNRD